MKRNVRQVFLILLFPSLISVMIILKLTKEHFNSYPDYAKKKLYDASPGLTGIRSVVFRDEEGILQTFDDKKSFHQNIISPYKAALECWYVDHKNIKNYFILIFMTVQVVLKPKNSAWKNRFKDLPPVPAELTAYI